MQIIKYPNPLLRQPCRDVTDEEFKASKAEGHEFDRLIEEMTGLMRANNGVGLAGPQVGLGLRMFIMESENGVHPVFNPRLWQPDGIDKAEEGCLSIPGVQGAVERAATVVLEARNSKGEQIKFSLQGMAAKVAQHEHDHLEGILFLDHFDWEGPKKVLRDRLGLPPEADPVAEFVKNRRRMAWAMKGDEMILGLSPFYMRLMVGEKSVMLDLERKEPSSSQRKKQKSHKRRRKRK